MEKVRRADICIWMDAFQFEAKGWVSRNRFSDGTSMTIPVASGDHFSPINRVRIADPSGRLREKAARTLENKLGPEIAAPFTAELRKPYRLLVGLNWQLLTRLQAALGIETVAHFQSHLESGYANVVPVINSEGGDAEAEALLPARDRIAHMVQEVGGTVWLSGPSGRNYLDLKPFEERGIRVEFFDYQGETNPSAIELLRKPKRPTRSIV